MQTIIRLATILTFLFFSNFLYAQSDDIIGKDDAKAMFAIGLEEWKQNLLTGKAAGAFDYDTDNNLEWTLISYPPVGKIVVTPSYSENDLTRPWKVSLSIVYYPQYSGLMIKLSDKEHRDLIAKAQRQLRPELTLMTKATIVQKDKIFIHDFQIFEVGKFPLMDTKSTNAKGCIEPCIVRK